MPPALGPGEASEGSSRRRHCSFLGVPRAWGGSFAAPSSPAPELQMWRAPLLQLLLCSASAPAAGSAEEGGEATGAPWARPPRPARICPAWPRASGEQRSPSSSSSSRSSRRFPGRSSSSSALASVKMLSDKAEKRIASSIFITLTPPQRGHLAGDGTLPQKASLCPGSFSREMVKTADASSPPSCLSAIQGGHPGAAGGPSRSNCSDLLPPPDLPGKTEESDRESLALPPPPFCVETLGPDLQSRTAAFSTPVQASSAFLPESKQNKCFPSTLGWTEQGQVATTTTAARSGRWCGRDQGAPSKDPIYICAFCHKAILPRTPTLEAMNKQYHADCFLCRVCQSALVGHRYYQKDGRPLCVACYQKSLEKCAKCQGLILDHIVRALGHAYHPECFTCAVCERALGDETFAVDDKHRAHCLDDFYRKFASMCGACARPIVPSEGRDSYKIECLGRSFHEDCFRCERCWVLLSPEPMENGCFPLGSSLLCKSCHLQQSKESSR